MNIEWKKVTWYSQALAIVLGILIFAVGFYIGTEYSHTKVSSQAEKVTQIPENAVVTKAPVTQEETVEKQSENDSWFYELKKGNFSSQKLGFSFEYAIDPRSEKPPYESGNKVFFDENTWIERIPKDPQKSFLALIKENYIPAEERETCYVVPTSMSQTFNHNGPLLKHKINPDTINIMKTGFEQETRQYAFINSRHVSPPVEGDPWYASYCGEYGSSADGSFFFFDTRFPDRYYFVHTSGQYFISGNAPNQRWFETVVIDR